MRSEKADGLEVKRLVGEASMSYGRMIGVL